VQFRKEQPTASLGAFGVTVYLEIIRVGNDKTSDIKPTGDTGAHRAAKPLAVQMMDFVADSAAAFATAIVTAGAMKADRAVNNARDVIATVDESPKAVTERLPRKTTAKRPPPKSTAAQIMAVGKRSLTKKAAPQRVVGKKAPARSRQSDR
jgi:hypothetical protein